MDNENLMALLNKFTRREFSEDEVYIFPVVLCDNEIDRDNERFSDKALAQLAERFIGVTGIFDHDPKGNNQTARIFSAEVITENRSNSLGEPYAYLLGHAYMVRTDSNADLIREIDGGIKKEVSVSCSAERQVCSICGADRRVKACNHAKGRIYGGKRCFFTLEEISDAYEWSFVAVPAQVNAGVTKQMSAEGNVGMSAEERNDSTAKIRRILTFRNADGTARKLFDAVEESLSDEDISAVLKLFSVPAVKCSCDEYRMEAKGYDS